jgi:hypothetical protein
MRPKVSAAHPMNHGGSWNFDFGKVKYVNAIHSSSFPDGTKEEIPAVLLSRNKNIYIAGRYGPYYGHEIDSNAY